MNNHISFSEKRKTYYVYYNNKIFSYSIKRYGELAKLLANKSLAEGIKYYDYYKIVDDYVIVYINTHKYGIKEVYINIDNIDIIKTMKISVYKDRNTYYATTKKGKLHRVILNANCNLVVDHINRNGLDNRKENLRLVSVSINNKNTKLRSDNSLGEKGITEDINRYRVFWYENKNKKSKSFSKNKYGKDEALNLAIEYRNTIFKSNGYLLF